MLVDKTTTKEERVISQGVKTKTAMQWMEVNSLGGEGGEGLQDCTQSKRSATDGITHSSEWRCLQDVELFGHYQHYFGDGLSFLRYKPSSSCFRRVVGLYRQYGAVCLFFPRQMARVYIYTLVCRFPPPPILRRTAHRVVWFVERSLLRVNLSLYFERLLVIWTSLAQVTRVALCWLAL